MNKHRTWLIVDGLASGLMVAATAHWGNGWLTLAVIAYGLWNYTDGLVRSRW